jgi:hypothetical protein
MRFSWVIEMFFGYCVCMLVIMVACRYYKCMLHNEGLTIIKRRMQEYRMSTAQYHE